MTQLFRALIAGSLVLAATVGTVQGAAAEHFARTTQPAPARQAIYLPRPTGSHKVGTALVHLVDKDRADPIAGDGSRRELMVQIWYPARDAARFPLAPYMPPKEAAWHHTIFPGIPPEADFQTPTHSHLGAPVLATRARRPVVLFSPGAGGNRTNSTVLAEEMASRGMVVVATASTHEAHEVEFPGGRLVKGRPYCQGLELITCQAALNKMVAIRVADNRYLLNQLTRITGGANPDAEGKPLPAGLAHSLDLGRVGMYGHSLGGATAADTMLEDKRVRVGVNLDGSMYGKAAKAGLDRPFLLFGGGYHTVVFDPTWLRFVSKLRGWHHLVRLRGAGHLRFVDEGANARAWGADKNLDPVRWQLYFGDINDHRALAIVRTYTTAFFEQFLQNQPRPILDGPTAKYPEVIFDR